MATTKVKLNLRGINQLMSSAPVQAEVSARAKRMAAAAGGNFEAVDAPHRWTARAYVRPANPQGMREEARDKRLTGAVNAAR